MPQQLEAWVTDEVTDVVLAAGIEVVDADDIVSGVNQPVAKVTAQKAGAAGDQNALRIAPAHSSSSPPELRSQANLPQTLPPMGAACVAMGNLEDLHPRAVAS